MNGKNEEFRNPEDVPLNVPREPASESQGSMGEGESPARVQQVRQWAMFLHLSLLAGFVIPLAGLVAPILIWQLKKTELPEIDLHGKIVVNWLISYAIYAVVSFFLVFIIIGIPLLVALGVIGIVFPIIGGIKANNGDLWKYPLSIAFLK